MSAIRGHHQLLMTLPRIPKYKSENLYARGSTTPFVSKYQISTWASLSVPTHGACAWRQESQVDRASNVVNTPSGSSLQLRSLADDSVVSSITHGYGSAGPTGLGLSASEIMACGVSSPYLKRWDRSTLVGLTAPAMVSACWKCRYSPDGTMFAVTGGSTDGVGARLRVYRSSDLALIYTYTYVPAFSGGPVFRGLSWSPDSTRLVAADDSNYAPQNRGILFVDVAAGTSTSILSGPRWLSVAWSPDGSKVVAGGGSGNAALALINASSLAVSYPFTTPSGLVNAIAFSADSQIIAHSDVSTARLRLYDANTYAPITGPATKPGFDVTDLYFDSVPE